MTKEHTKESTKTGHNHKEMTKTDTKPVHVVHSILTGEVRSDEQELRSAHRIAEGEIELRETIEKAMKLRRFEDPTVFKLALELVVRRIRRYGKHINWPNPEVVTMMTLKAEGLPTEPEELLTLMREAVPKRGETLNIEEVENDLCVVYGRRVFRPDQPDPHCHGTTHERPYESDSEGPIMAPKPAGFFQILKEVWRSGKHRDKKKEKKTTGSTREDRLSDTTVSSQAGNGVDRPYEMKYRPKIERPPPVQDWERRIAKLGSKLKSTANHSYSGPTSWHSPYPPQIKVAQEKVPSRIWGGNFVERCLSLGQDLNKSGSRRRNHQHGESVWRTPSMPSVAWTSNTYASTPYKGCSHIYESIPGRSVVEGKHWEAQRWTSSGSLTYSSKSGRTDQFRNNFTSYSRPSQWSA